MSKNNYDEQLKQEAIESVKKILAQSKLSEFVTISSIPERSGKFLLNYGNITFKCKEKNSWNLNGINVYVKKGNKVDRTNPRQIQFKLVADYSDEVINGKFLGCKYAFMQEICTRCNAWMAQKHGVFCFEEDAIDVANCIAEIMAEGDKKYFADYDENDKETKSRIFVNHEEFLNEAFSTDTTNKNVIGVLQPEKETVSVTLYKRDPLVVAETLRIANGYCELCEVKSPFKTKSGRDYLEVHHVIPLSKQGSDTVSNTVALCPNCHRMLHFGDNAEDMMAKLNKIKRLDCF
ncbi:HNH endonuclease [Photobacterium damselae]|uniref:HNH endonuclease n=1 Tax=Photobacterium damselae TaxID=38293 RepID=UPI001EFCC1C3|nr:HNH endonuclease [Photobacterium damselae]MCG9777611.1 HNH endonuclease [Photobacterium damselae]